ncbi:HpcH/HpaI aldolase/citrate lyase family protein [Billgrantia gudaonensis]|uniref:(S)-citramalyl-CoA lyase n=1 Tax=Billgrantia gudaonensis TaxID=376427 RepID=A0A1G9BY22_9GAMM|nr:CoA ester lyase [Halomonas gudaonensis]SDK43845.1 (S)-citramalyl-CoA lyase [Halomonas gudaonensis]
MPLALHRSLLFVPASRPERIAKALASDADGVIVDLEDAVAPDDKENARQWLDDYLVKTPDARLMVRVNAVSSDAFDADLALCARHPGIVAVMLPKAETLEAVARVSDTGKPVYPLIETARGLLALPRLCQAHGVARVSFGALDMATELDLIAGTPGAESMLDQCRYQLVVASSAAGLAPPLESVVPEIDDLARVESVARRAAEMGFAGMLCIHPRQLSAIHPAFTPNAATLDWAARVVARADEGASAFQLDGRMVDAPVIARARSLLARAESLRMNPPVEGGQH